MPTDMSQYPDNWTTEIRPNILKRATDKYGIERCEQCGCINNRWIWYHPSAADYPEVAHLWTQNPDDAWDWYGAHQDDMESFYKCGYQVVLTIAHIQDPDPMNCHPDNLKALCQTCHNRYDSDMRRMNRIRNKVSDKQLRLF